MKEWEKSVANIEHFLLYILIVLTVIAGLLFVLVLTPVMVFASTPDFTFSQSLTTSLNVGTNNIGNIVFVKQPYIATNVVISTVTNTNAQKFDVLRWTGSLSIQITAPDGVVSILSNNQALQLTQVGTYNYNLLSDPSQSATITVIAENPLTISMSRSTNDLTINGLGDQTITGTELSVPISLVVDQSDAIGNYPTHFTFTSMNNTKTLDVTFVVLADGNFSVTDDSLNSTIVAQSNTLVGVGYIKLKNTGNSDEVVTSQITGNGSTFLQTQSTQSLFKNGETIFNFQVQVPNSQTDGQYIANIYLTSGNTSYNKSVAVNIHDTTSPKINNLTLSSYDVLIPTNITVDATDNINVANVTLTIDGVQFNTTKDQQLFTIRDYVFNSTGIHTLIACAKDLSDNQFCLTLNPTFNQLNYIHANSSIVMPTKKIGTNAQVYLFNLTPNAKANFTLQLADFTSDLLGNETFRQFKIQLQDSNNIVYPILNIGDNVTMNPSLWVQLQIYVANVTQYSARFKFLVPDTVVPQQDVLVNGVFRSYNVPTNFDKILNGKRIWSNVYDTGDYTTSYQDICQQFPLSDDESSLSIVTSLRERTIIDNRYNETTVGLQKKVTFWRFTTVFSWVIVLLSLLIAVFMIKYYPRMRNRK